MKLVAYLNFPGTCEKALNFYKETLGGQITHMSKMGETQGMEIPDHLKNNVMHASLKFGDNELFMSDTFDASSVKQGNNVTLSLHIDDVNEEEKLFTKLSEGGTVTMPLQDTFWGARFGMLVD